MIFKSFTWSWHCVILPSTLSSWRSVAVVVGSGLSLQSLTCPSCHNKKVVQLAHHLKETILYPVLHRQYVFTIPKILCKFIFYNPKLLGKLSQCAVKSLTKFFQFTLDGLVKSPMAFPPPRPGGRRSLFVKKIGASYKSTSYQLMSQWIPQRLGNEFLYVLIMVMNPLFFSGHTERQSNFS